MAKASPGCCRLQKFRSRLPDGVAAGHVRAGGSRDSTRRRVPAPCSSRCDLHYLPCPGSLPRRGGCHPHVAPSRLYAPYGLRRILTRSGYLQAMGVHDCFGRLYGPDLIDTFKEGPEYYERMFADLGIAPADALVVDDCPRAIGWAMQVGARTVLVGDSSLPQRRTTLYIANLVELPALLQ